MSIICRVKAAIHSGRLDAKDGERIIEALEKQIPKKTIRDNENPTKPICPCCNRYFYFRYIGEYCIKCGQRVDRSDLI